VSSAILYVAIVAIWIGVLVPRWLHHDGAQGATGLRRLSRHFGGSRPADSPQTRPSTDAESRAGFDPEGRPRYTSFVPPEHGQDAPAARPEPQVHHEEKVSSPVSGNRESMAQLYEADAPQPPVRSYGWSAEEAVRQERRSQKSPGQGRTATGEDRPRAPRAPQPSPVPPAPRAPHDDSPEPADADDAPAAYYGYDEEEEAVRRDKLVRSRRWNLGLLVALTLVGVALVGLHLAAWWIIIPPVVLLGGYLLLLREAAQADAEARERREAELAAQDRPAHETSETPAHPVPAHEAPAPAPAAASHETGPRADIIDISEHVGDQLYDQYADAKLRAVGD
jgi:hypothetical protein